MKLLRFLNFVLLKALTNTILNHVYQLHGESIVWIHFAQLLMNKDRKNETQDT